MWSKSYNASIFIKVRTDYNSWRLEGRKKGKESAKKGEKGKLVPDELCTILDL